MEPLLEVKLPELELLYRGKVQDHYKPKNPRLSRTRLVFFTDRISAKNKMLGFGIECKGVIQRTLTVFFKGMMRNIVPSDIVSSNQYRTLTLCGIGGEDREMYMGRCLLIDDLDQVPVECIVKDYYVGSLIEGYEKKEPFAIEHHLPSDPKKYDKLPMAIFIPSIKNKQGNDENVSYEQLVEFLKDWLARDENKHITISAELLAQLLRSTTLAIFAQAKEYFLAKGLILADFKLEFGLRVNDDGSFAIMWSDEGLTPDTVRVWFKETWGEGKIPVGLDKDIIRDFLDENGVDAEVPEDLRKRVAKVWMDFGEKTLPPEVFEKQIMRACA